MEDTQVYEKIDNVLKEMLSTKTIKESYDSLLQNKSSNTGNQIIKKYLESIGYTFFEPGEQELYRTLFKGKEISFQVQTIFDTDKIKISLPINFSNETSPNFYIIFSPNTKEIWRVKSSVLHEYLLNSSNSISYEETGSYKIFSFDLNEKTTKDIFIHKDLGELFK
jgi:hypothetical protein